jgi:glycosyltransferase involved in cell wall biosynthesis
MRILVAHNRYRPTAPSGEDKVVDQEAAALAARGHTVALFERHSADIVSWPRHRKATLPLRVVWSEDSRRAIAAELVRFAPDVVHVHNTFPLLTPAILHACRDASVPVVATLHNYKLGCASGELFRQGAVCHACLGASPLPALAHGCYRGSRAATAPVVLGRAMHASAWRSLVSAYIFISAAQRDVLEPVGLPTGRSFVKHNFVPPNPESPTDDPTEHVVAFVGRLDAAKGAAFLIRAWDAFRARRPGSLLRLVVAGGGPLEDDVARWAAGDPTVTVAGLVPREEAARILGRARAAVIPSQWEETFGLVAVEAMAAGTAAVASSHGAFPELITSGWDGALFAPSDPDALVDVLADVDDNPGRWDGYGRRARETYRRRFAPEGNVDRLLDIYRFAMEHPIEELHSGVGIAGTFGGSSSQGELRLTLDGEPNAGRRQPRS